jgi:hypothetical protein
VKARSRRARLRFDAFKRVGDGVSKLGESVGVAFYSGRVGRYPRVREDEAQDLLGGVAARLLRVQFFDERVNESRGFSVHGAERVAEILLYSP